MKPLKYWTPDGFEISSFKYSLKDRINKNYDTSGGDNTKKCKYSYNELGFRGDSKTKNGYKKCIKNESNNIYSDSMFCGLFTK
jgi:hypothetical protein